MHRTIADYVGEVLALVGAVSGVLLLVSIWPDLPDQIPRRFLLTGEPAAWTDRWMVGLPIGIAVAIYIGLTLLNRAPHIFNYPWPITQQNAAIQYRLMRSMVTWLKALCVWMLVAIVWSQARVALGDAHGVPPLMIIGFLVGIHAVLVLFIYRSYRCREGDPSNDPFATGADQSRG